MSTRNTILLLGTNLGNKEKNLKMARTLLTENIGKVTKEGKIIKTEPVGFTSDSLFLNQIITIETYLSPYKVLHKIKKIEHQMGRIYTKPLKDEKYVSRIIDIDILYFDNLKFASYKLTIPHNQLRTRDFVKDMLKTY